MGKAFWDTTPPVTAVLPVTLLHGADFALTFKKQEVVAGCC